MARLSPTEFDFSDLLALIPPPDPNAKPSTRTMTVERLTLTNGALVARDDVTKTTWKIDALNVDGHGLGTRPGPPGRLTLGLKLNGTPVTVVADAVDVVKGAVLPRVTVAGDITRDGLAVQLADATTPFVTIGALAMTLAESEPLARRIAVKSVAIDGVDVKVARLKDGSIDVVALVAAKPGPVAPASPAAGTSASSGAAATAAAPTGEPQLNVTVQNVQLRNARITLRDDAVDTTLALSELTVAARDIALPGTSPLAFDVSTGLPGAGKLLVKGTATLTPVAGGVHDVDARRHHRALPGVHPDSGTVRRWRRRRKASFRRWRTSSASRRRSGSRSRRSPRRPTPTACASRRSPRVCRRCSAI